MITGTIASYTDNLAQQFTKYPIRYRSELRFLVPLLELIVDSVSLSDENLVRKYEALYKSLKGREYDRLGHKAAISVTLNLNNPKDSLKPARILRYKGN